MADKSSEAMNVRFLINTKTQRIVYAEAGKEFVDFLFSFLSLPIGSVLKLLNALESNRKVGSVSNLYGSMEKLPSQFMSTDKSQLLDPKFVTTYTNNTLRIEGGNYYICSYLSGNTDYHEHVSEEPEDDGDSYPSTNTTHNFSTSSGERCICGQTINRLVQLRQNRNVNQATRSSSQTVNYKLWQKTNVNYQASGSSTQTAGQGNSGYVKEMLTFIITDDLKITVSSTITSIMLLKQLNIKDLADLEERTAIADRNKALEILEASLVSTTVLNDVFGAQFSASGKPSVAE